MIYEFGFRNFFSFQEGAVLSFRLDANTPVQLSKGLDYVNALGLKGSNASGKTCVLRALTFVMYFASDSFESAPDDRNHVESFFNNGDASEFYIEFSIAGILYRYDLAVSDKEIISESLVRKKSRDTLVFERKSQKLTYRTQEFKDLDKIILRKNASIISLAYNYEIKKIFEIHNFFNSYTTNVTYSGLREKPLSILTASKFLSTRPDALNFVKSFIKKIDTGISNIKINSTKNEKGEKIFFPVFEHTHNNLTHSLPSNLESSGTRALFRNLGMHWLLLQNGGVVIVDEIDSNLHTLVLPEIIELYSNPKINKKNAQLIFTTHNTEILDVLGRYRTYLVNKENNSSYAYRLDEIPGELLRNDRTIITPYLDGKIGGIPIIK